MAASRPPRWRPIAVCSIAEALAQLERLGEVARGHRDVVAVGAQALDHGAHDEHVRAVREIDPDAHRARTVTLRDRRVARASRVLPARPVSLPAVLVLASISETLVNETSHFVRDAGLPGIFVLMVDRERLHPDPLGGVMLFAGFAVADPGQSAAHHHLTLVGIVLAGLLGTSVGSWIAYAVGRGGRLELLERHGARLHMRPAQIERADRWFAALRRARGAVRPHDLPIVRAFISLPAGVARMPFGRFTLFSLLGCDPVGARPGARRSKRVGGNWTSVRKGFEYVDYVVVALVVSASSTPSCAAGAAAASRRPMQPAERALSRCATPWRWACCTARPSCCRSPPPRTPRSLPWLARLAATTRLDGELRKSFEVALHAGAGAGARDRHAPRAARAGRAASTRAGARARAARSARRRSPGSLLRAADRAPPRRPAHRSPRGCAGGAVAMALADARRARGRGAAAREARGCRDGLALGLAQAARADPGRLAQRRDADRGSRTRASPAAPRRRCRGRSACP